MAKHFVSFRKLLGTSRSRLLVNNKLITNFLEKADILITFTQPYEIIMDNSAFQARGHSKGIVALVSIKGTHI